MCIYVLAVFSCRACRKVKVVFVPARQPPPAEDEADFWWSFGARLFSPAVTLQFVSCHSTFGRALLCGCSLLLQPFRGRWERDGRLSPRALMKHQLHRPPLPHHAEFDRKFFTFEATPEQAAADKAAFERSRPAATPLVGGRQIACSGSTVARCHAAPAMPPDRPEPQGSSGMCWPPCAPKIN